MTNHSNSKKLLIVTVCITLVLIAAIGGWVYTNQQQIAQKNQELQQQKELTEYEQQQINERAAKDRQCDDAKNSDNEFLRSISCQ